LLLFLVLGALSLPAAAEEEIKQAEKSWYEAVLKRDELKYRVDALDRDAQTQELEVRRQLGKARKGEIIIKVDPPKP
ncbi:MAG: hypothetical protein ACK6DZ_01000, partial [Acidobacteriota bacterium]